MKNFIKSSNLLFFVFRQWTEHQILGGQHNDGSEVSRILKEIKHQIKVFLHIMMNKNHLNQTCQTKLPK